MCHKQYGENQISRKSTSCSRNAESGLLYFNNSLLNQQFKISIGSCAGSRAIFKSLGLSECDKLLCFHYRRCPKRLELCHYRCRRMKMRGNNIGLARCFYPFKAISFDADAAKLKIEKSK